MSQRYYSLRKHLSEQFSHYVAKVCVDAGFTCPNRDGTKGRGGCFYCNEFGSGADYINRSDSLDEQILKSVRTLKRYNPNPQYLVYFQSFSNTYASVKELNAIYTKALDKEGAVGLCIGTRPDCITPEIVELLKEYSKKTYLWLELGMETIHDETLHKMNRKHTYQEFLDAYNMIKESGIRVCVHMIIGLPGESDEQIFQSAEALAALKPDGVKFHSLYLERNTKLYDQFQKNSWVLLSRSRYSELAASCLELMPKDTVIHRLVGSARKETLFAPKWTANKKKVILGIESILKERNSFQGARFNEAVAKEEQTCG